VFTPLDDCSTPPVPPVLTVLPSAGDSVGKACASPDDPTRMTYAVNEDNVNIYTPIFTALPVLL
jgi:hypothetical protein